MPETNRKETPSVTAEATRLAAHRNHRHKSNPPNGTVKAIARIETPIRQGGD
ncbi:MAG: hypothetical protein Q8N96_04135 [Methylovulum sp.]|nr:hypothetical protein [Methylovulum sp.]